MNPHRISPDEPLTEEDVHRVIREIPGILKGIRHTVTVLVWATIFLFLAMGGVVAYVVVNQSDTNDALCTFRGNLVQQVNDTQTFLAKHPDGLPALGVSATQLQAQELRLQASADSLSGLGCNGQTIGGEKK